MKKSLLYLITFEFFFSVSMANMYAFICTKGALSAVIYSALFLVFFLLTCLTVFIALEDEDNEK